MPDKHRRNAAICIAKEAIALAEEYDLSPSPVVFEVLVKHLQGLNEQLCAAVTLALKGPQNEREAAIAMIQAEYLSQSALQSGLERLHLGLSNELSGAIEQLSDGMKGNLRMADELRSTLRDIAGHVTKEELQFLCKHLAISNRTHLSTTQSVSHRLESTQAQLTEMKTELSILREAASTDHLTGLPNRRYLENKLSTLLTMPGSLCFAIIDLDHFKTVNDNWGHAVGDNILRGIGQILHQNTKGKDFAARIGGEEFALVLPDTPLSGARQLCETIRTTFAEILWVSQANDQEIGSFTLSCGVTERMASDTRQSIFERADGLLYQAKNAGRDQVAYAA